MDNSTGKILNIIGCILMALGFIIGVVAWIIIANDISGIAGFGTFIGILAGSFVSGMLFIGFSEVIFLLQENNNIQKEAKTKNNEKNNINKKKNSFNIKTVIEKNEEKNIKSVTDDEYEDFECPYCDETISVLKSDVEKGKIECPFCGQTVLFE